MLTRKPPPFFRRYSNIVYYFFYNPIVAQYRKIRKPHNQGVKVLLFNGDKVLLVRIGYAHKMGGFPGDAIDTGETAEAAAIRELQEESGIEVSSVTHVMERTWQKDGLVTVQYFSAKSDKNEIVIDNQEIIDAGWFSLDNLPEGCNPTAKQIITQYENSKH